MGQTVHVLPVNDIVDHEAQGDTCICGPTSELVPCDGEPDGWVILHHSLDGRETRELR